MRKIRLFLTLFLFFCFTASQSYSQRDPVYNLGVDPALPVGDLSNFSSFGIGVTAKGLWGIGSGESMIGGHLGIMNFLPKGDFNSTINLIPLYVDFRQYFGNFFIEPMVGFSFELYKKSEFDVVTPSFGDLTRFGWAIGGGYTVNEMIDFSLRYESVHKKGSLGYIALRVGYNF